MDASLISAASALGGASIGGTISFLGSWIVQRREQRAQWLVQDRIRRQDLYKEFIQEASKCFADALQNDKPNIALFVTLYEKMSRMRIISSSEVLVAADQVLNRLVDALFQPTINLTNAKLREIMESGSADVLRGFSEACRAEFAALRAQQF